MRFLPPTALLPGGVEEIDLSAHLQHRPLDDATALVIACCIRGNRALRSLTLRADEMSAAAIASLAAVVNETGLEHLDLDGYPLPLQGLRGGQSAVQLHGARLGLGAARVVAACLSANTTLCSLTVLGRAVRLPRPASSDGWHPPQQRLGWWNGPSTLPGHGAP